MTDVTQVLDAIGRGDQQASEQLLPILYQGLRRLAANLLAREPAGQTLEATALMHEAYVRLVDRGDEPGWKHRGHFFAAAAEAMRRILVEQVRRKRSAKHDGGHVRVDLDERLVCSVPSDQFLALDEALERLDQEEPAKAQLVKLRFFFAGLSIKEAAEVGV
jgi:RNA polymerase sigma factor (TIGR02999 family)